MRKALSIVALCGALALVAGCSGSGSTPATTTTTTTAVPSAPTALTATATGTQVALSWTASAGATSYTVYYSTTSGVTTSTGTKVGSLTATTYTVTGLTAGTTYYFIVTATNAGGESTASTSASAAVPVAVPSAPTGVTAASGNAQVTVSFTGSTGATSYNLYYSLTSGVTAANGTKITGVTSPYVQTGLTNGAAYYYVVTAVNASGESAASSQATATPLPPLPAAPTALTAVPSGGQVALSWTASSGATSYNIYYGTTAAMAAVGMGTKVGSISGTTYNVTGLTNGTLYYFVVSAVNLKGESTASNQVNATPTAGVTVNLVPGTASTATLQAGATTSLTFNFPAGAVSQPVTATISPVTLAALPVPLLSEQKANAQAAVAGQAVTPKAVQPTDTFTGSFNIQLSPSSVTAFNVPITIAGSVGTAYNSGSTVNLAYVMNSQWVDTATFIVDSKGAITENIPSFSLPGLVNTGSYLVYQAASGNNTAVSNLGVALIADDGGVMKDGSNGLQVIHIFDAAGNVLPTPTISYLDYPGAGDLDGQALTPDGSQGIMVDGGNTLRFFSSVQTGTPLVSKTTLSLSSTFGSDGDSVAILPNGDEAVVSADASGSLLVVSGILAGTPVAAAPITVPSNRDGLVISNDGKVMLARGGAGLTVFAIAPITPVKGSAGGTISHSFTLQKDFPTLGSNYYFEDGREGMSISPVDSSRAVLVQDGTTAVIQMMTGLTTTPVAGTPVTLPSGTSPLSVSVSPDGKLAVVGTYTGLLLYSGVDTGTLTLVGTRYAPTYKVGTTTATLGSVATLGITLDNKYVIAGDQNNSAVVVVPFTSTGFAAAPASLLGSVAVPSNDQLVVR